jgi:hypothetical protein
MQLMVLPEGLLGLVVQAALAGGALPPINNAATELEASRPPKHDRPTPLPARIRTPPCY